MSKEHLDIILAVIGAMAVLLTAFAGIMKFFLFPKKPKTEEKKDIAESEKMEAESQKLEIEGQKIKAEVNGINTQSLIAIVNTLQVRIEHADREAERLRELVSTLRADVILLQQRAVDIEVIRAKERLAMEKTITDLQAEVIRLKARLKALEPEGNPGNA